MKMLSIIVPVYNVQSYLEKCIQSILLQDYNNYELILVDDGSTDNSGEICDKYAFNKKVKVYHKKNGGLSDTRNFGIKKSDGKYIMFVDSDDFLYNIHCLKKINDYIEESEADVIQYKMVYYYEKKNKYVFLKDLKEFNGSVLEKISSLNENGQVSVSACDKIVKAEIIKNKNIYFENDLLSEDIKWSYELYLNIDTLKIVNDNIYVYRQQRINSISTSKTKKNVCDLFKIIKYWYNYPYNSIKLKTLYFNLISYWYLILRTNYKKSYYNQEMKKFFKDNDALLLNYHNNYKVNKAYKLNKIVGYSLTIYVMKIYIFLKDRGIVKI